MNFKSEKERKHQSRMICDVCCMNATNPVPISDDWMTYHGKTFVCPQKHKWHFAKGIKYYKIMMEKIIWYLKKNNLYLFQKGIMISKVEIKLY